MKSMSKRILVTIPTYNEAFNIERLVDEILDQQTTDSVFDIIVIDDESPDGTAARVRAHEAFNQKLFLITRQEKSGRGGAVLDGFRFALKRNIYDFVLEMDGDFSHDPKEIPKLIRACESNDIVVATRYLRTSKIYGWPLRRRLFSAFANFYARTILRIPLYDYTNCYRCYKFQLLRTLDFSKIRARGYIVVSEIAYQFYLNGAKIGMIPTIFINRKRGASNLSLSEICEAFLAVPRIYRNYTTERFQYQKQQAKLRAGDN